MWKKTGIFLYLSVMLISAGCSNQHLKVLPTLPKPIVSASGFGQARTRTIQSPGLTATSLASGKPVVGPISKHWYPPFESNRWTCIVIHHSANENGGAARYNKAHQARGWDELGYHFVIGNGTATSDGTVEVGPRWRKQKHGAHCKTPDNYYNEHGIGICLVGNFENHTPSGRQIKMVRKLVLFLMKRYNIPSSRVYGHGELGATKCPGEYFSIDRFRGTLEASGVVWARSR